MKKKQKTILSICNFGIFRKLVHSAVGFRAGRERKGNCAYAGLRALNNYSRTICKLPAKLRDATSIPSRPLIRRGTWDNHAPFLTMSTIIPAAQAYVALKKTRGAIVIPHNYYNSLSPFTTLASPLEFLGLDCFFSFFYYAKRKWRTRRTSSIENTPWKLLNLKVYSSKENYTSFEKLKKRAINGKRTAVLTSPLRARLGECN